MGPAIVEGPLGRGADVRRRIEIGLADLEVDHMPPGLLERTSAGSGLEGGFGSKAGHPVGQTHGGDASKRDPHESATCRGQRFGCGGRVPL